MQIVLPRAMCVHCSLFINFVRHASITSCHTCPITIAVIESMTSRHTHNYKCHHTCRRVAFIIVIEMLTLTEEIVRKKNILNSNIQITKWLSFVIII